MIQGLQGTLRGGLSSNQSVVSNPKHFAAHSIPEVLVEKKEKKKVF